MIFVVVAAPIILCCFCCFFFVARPMTGGPSPDSKRRRIQGCPLAELSPEGLEQAEIRLRSKIAVLKAEKEAALLACNSRQTITEIVTLRREGKTTETNINGRCDSPTKRRKAVLVAQREFPDFESPSSEPTPATSSKRRVVLKPRSENLEAAAAALVLKSNDGCLVLNPRAGCDDLPRGLQCRRIPRIEPWGRDQDHLINALSLCGAAFIDTDHFRSYRNECWPDPGFHLWHDLWQEALSPRQFFKKRKLFRNGHLKYSRGEDLRRTLEGESKQHTPDVRYNFGMGKDVLQQQADKWDDLCWIRDNFEDTLDLFAELLRREINLLTEHGGEETGSLGAKLQEGTESWGSSRLRHCIYPSGGSCTEHTDYGVVTFQHSTSTGLEAYISEQWQPLDPPTGCVLLFAGDMFERLTNGSVPALKHRVRIGDDSASDGEDHAARQSHILFLQPDKQTIVQPLKSYLRGDGTDLPPVKYKEWHQNKSTLAWDK